MIIVKRFVNKLMSSNCYVVSEEGHRNCIVIDPGTEDCEEIIEYFENQDLDPEYVFLTHEHSDHTWGCNTLIDKYNSKIVTSQTCKEALPKESNAYFQFYFDDSNYTYYVKRVDVVMDEIDHRMVWYGYNVKFLETPGHSDSSICISIENNLFTGDTLMQFKPFIFKRCSKKDTLTASINKIIEIHPREMKVFPGHGDVFKLGDYVI